MPTTAEQLELFARAQAHVILIRARSEAFEAWQSEASLGSKKPPHAEGFTILTHSIQRLYNKGE